MMPDDARRLRLRDRIAAEVLAIEALLPVLHDIQYDRSPAGMAAPDETGRRATGGHGDPTGDLACDPNRLYVRAVLTRCDAVLANALAQVGGVRRGLERALEAWEGAYPEDEKP